MRSLVSKPEKPATPPPGADEDAREAGLVSALLGGVSIVPEQGTRLVTIFYRHSDPDFAAQAANAFAEEYTQQNLDLRLQNTDKMLGWITNELKREEDQLGKAESDLTRYRESKNALSLEDRQNIVVQRLNSLNDSVTKARTGRLTRETAFNQLKGADPANDSNRLVSHHRGESGRGRSQEQAPRRAGGEGVVGEPQLRSGMAGDEDRRRRDCRRASAADRRADQRHRIGQERSNAATEEERHLSSSLEEAKGASMDLDRKSGDYRILQRKADSDRQVYQSLLAQQKELRVVANSRANNVQVMERAEVPKFPISPNPRRDWITAILAGLTVAIGLAFGIEYLDDTVKTPDDVTRRLSCRCSGWSRPFVESAWRFSPANVPHDFGEAFRSLRTSLVFTSGGDARGSSRSPAANRSKARPPRRATLRWRWRWAARGCC